jgi:hypothetical protein
VIEVSATPVVLGNPDLADGVRVDPEENPDYYATASAVEAACWMSGMSKDYPEHLDAGLSLTLGDGEILLWSRYSICQLHSGYQRLHGPETAHQYPKRGSRTGRPAGGQLLRRPMEGVAASFAWQR